jgi:arsenate reductase
MSKQTVLILCTANSARSQMAEALLRRKVGDRFAVRSAGIEPGRVNPFAIQAIEELGISMEGHRSKHLNEFLGRVKVDHLITVCDNAAERCPTVWPGVTERLHWPFDDPAAATGSDQDKLQRFREIRDRISAKLDDWLATLGGTGNDQ